MNKRNLKARYRANRVTSKRISEMRNRTRRSRRMTEAYSNELEAVIRNAESNALDTECIAVLIKLYQDFDFTADELNEIVDNDEIEHYDNYVELTVWKYSFLVFDDKDEAYNAAVEDSKALFDDIGLDSLSDEFDYDKYIDEDWFKETLTDMEENRYYEMADEYSDEFENALVEECYNRGLIDDSDFRDDEFGVDYKDCIKSTDRLVSMCVADYVADIDNWIQEYIFNFGQDDFNHVINTYGLVDFNSMAKECVNIDGIAHYLASYDGEERVVYDLHGKDYYIYRT